MESTDFDIAVEEYVSNSFRDTSKGGCGKSGA
jgi:hypothetical protein